jgi:hypothetical protein
MIQFSVISLKDAFTITPHFMQIEIEFFSLLSL